MFHAESQRAQSIRRCRSYVPSGWKLRAIAMQPLCSLRLCVRKTCNVKFVPFVGDKENRAGRKNSFIRTILLINFWSTDETDDKDFMHRSRSHGHPETKHKRSKCVSVFPAWTQSPKAISRACHSKPSISSAVSSRGRTSYRPQYCVYLYSTRHLHWRTHCLYGVVLIR